MNVSMSFECRAVRMTGEEIDAEKMMNIGLNEGREAYNKEVPIE